MTLSVLPPAGGQNFFTTSGSLTSDSGAGSEVELVCPGTSSAAIHLSGTFEGTVEVVGRATIGSNPIGGRLIFKSGVGSLGRNNVDFAGTQDQEWRVVTGGYSVIVRCTNYVSGTLDLEIGATIDPSLIFINGPVRTSEEEALRAGRAYIAATPLTSVSTGNFLHVKIDNPIGSGTNIFLTNRRFSNTGGNVLTYQAFINPTATPSTAGNVGNRRLATSGSTAPTATFEYETNSNGSFLGGIASSVEGIPADGVPNDRLLLAEITPGQSLGFTIAGAGGGPFSGNVTAILEFYEELVA